MFKKKGYKHGLHSRKVASRLGLRMPSVNRVPKKEIPGPIAYGGWRTSRFPLRAPRPGNSIITSGTEPGNFRVPTVGSNRDPTSSVHSHQTRFHQVEAPREEAGASSCYYPMIRKLEPTSDIRARRPITQKDAWQWISKQKKDQPFFAYLAFNGRLHGSRSWAGWCLITGNRKPATTGELRHSLDRCQWWAQVHRRPPRLKKHGFAR